MTIPCFSQINELHAGMFDRAEAKKERHRAGEKKRKDKIRDGIHRINQLLPTEYQQDKNKKIVSPLLLYLTKK